MKQQPIRPLLFAVGMVVALVTIGHTPAQAVPLLQLYIEGATYESGDDEETWVLNPTTPGQSFRLWAIGNLSGPGGKGDIKGVKLSAVYDSNIDVNILLIPSTTLDYLNYTDPSTPGIPTTDGVVHVGGVPQLGDGSDLPSHGEYGPNKSWQEFQLGDFVLRDSEINDFINSAVPAQDGAPLVGQINVYDITIASSSTEPFSIHFDLYDHYEAKNGLKYKFAPFSHDGEGTPPGPPGDSESPVPEPSSIMLFGLGTLTMSGFIYRRRQTAA